MDGSGGLRAGSGSGGPGRGPSAKTSSSSSSSGSSGGARASDSPGATAAKTAHTARAAGADTKATEAALRDLDLLLEQLQSEKRRMADVQKEDEVDSLTRQMVQAMGSQEEIKWNATIKREVADFGDCFVCGKGITQEALVMGQTHLHPACFLCHKCRKPLGTDTYYVVDGHNVCQADRDLLLEKCSACGETIDGDTIRPKETKQPFHPRCFTCADCKKEITGKYYTVGEKIVCEDDYKQSCSKCARCAQPITTTTLTALGQKFHATCFVCSACGCSLDGVQFFVSKKDGKEKPICDQCYAKHEAKQCSGCSEAILEDCVVSRSEPPKYFHKKCYNNNKQ